MSTEVELILKALGTFIVGLLVAHGYATPENANSLVNDAISIGGILMSLYATIIFLDHAFLKFKDDLAHVDWKPQEPSTVTTEPANPTPAPPAA